MRSLSHHASAAYIVSLCLSGFGLLSNHHLSQAIKLYNSSCATNMVYTHQMSPRNSNLATSIIHISDEWLAWTLSRLPTCALSSDCSRPSGTSLINAEVMWWHITSAFGEIFSISLVGILHCTLIIIRLSAQKMEGLLCRWALSLQEFNFTIKYCKGSTNNCADALSRQEVQRSDKLCYYRRFGWKDY